ncbi:hypothetical protein PENSOL_c080G00831 [Penicillium solitum]|uniref:Uncharacterized protein n=1 Tax=Penicillium solitum TaxID=60172 RepID=A0A1V6QDS2_9EURO|nr:hypothetical protein PENSOL_c080G00831 [Penicillium solitum]
MSVVTKVAKSKQVIPNTVVALA